MSETTLVLPLDEHNQKLVDNVHPDGWENPEPKAFYHLVVLGGGTAGLVAAARAAELGARVALVEKHLLGGERLISGSVPTQAISRAARAWAEARRAPEFGVRFEGAQPQFTDAMRRMRRIRAEMSAQDSAWRYRSLGIDVFLGSGRFSGPETIAVGEKTLRFHRALVATGTRSVPTTIPGIGEGGYLTHESVYALTRVPRRFVVVGGDASACEIAQAFARFGSEVSLVETAPRILPLEEVDAATVVRAALERDGVKVYANARQLEVASGPRGRILRFEGESGPVELRADEFYLVAARSPNVEGVQLELAGVASRADGVDVDDELRTKNPKVFACGGVVAPMISAHLAEAHARIVIDNALLGRRMRASRLVFPHCTFTSPEVVRVGATEQELGVGGTRFATLKVPMAEIDRARLDESTDGIVVIHYRKRSGAILGGTIVGEQASEMGSELALAIAKGLTLGDLASTVRPYPTRSVVLQRAGETFKAAKLGKWSRRWLRFQFGRTARRGERSAAAAGAASQPPPNAL